MKFTRLNYLMFISSQRNSVYPDGNDFKDFHLIVYASWQTNRVSMEIMLDNNSSHLFDWREKLKKGLGVRNGQERHDINEIVAMCRLVSIRILRLPAAEHKATQMWKFHGNRMIAIKMEQLPICRKIENARPEKFKEETSGWHACSNISDVNHIR